MKMFTTIAVATAFLGLAACTKNEPAPAPTEAVTEVTAENSEAPVETAPVVEEVGGSARPAEGGVEQPK